ncbi:hypothetical protein RCL1_006168 [Eukaryota sp. TZLM3-RCL]
MTDLSALFKPFYDVERSPFDIEHERVATPFETVEAALEATLNTTSLTTDMENKMLNYLRTHVLRRSHVLPTNFHSQSSIKFPTVTESSLTSLCISFSFYHCHLFSQGKFPNREIVTALDSPLLDLINSFSCPCRLVTEEMKDFILYTKDSVFASPDSVLAEQIRELPSIVFKDFNGSTVKDLVPVIGQRLVLVVGNRLNAIEHLIVIRSIRTPCFWECSEQYTSSVRTVAIHDKMDVLRCDICSLNGAIKVVECHPLASNHPSLWCSFCLERANVAESECGEVQDILASNQ